MSVVQITFSLVCIAASVVANSPNDAHLQWKKHYDSSKQSAQAGKRPMLVVLENPTKKSEKIDETKLTDKDRKILAKEKFELCRVDVNTDYGKRVAKAFGASVFPYTVVTDDSSKRIVFRKPGQMSEQDWTLALAKNIREPAAQSVRVHVAKPVTSQPIVTSPTPTATSQGWTEIIPANGTIVIPQGVPTSGTCFT